MKRKLLTTMMLIACPFFSTPASAQTNEFTYQGKLSDSGTPSPTYDFEFRLCASESDCPTPLQIKEQLGVSVSNGIFTVKLDFDAAHFTGEDRFLEIRVRRNSGESWTPLNPRQKITSSPYSIKSLSADTSTNSLQLNGVAANQFVQTNDARLSDDRNPLPNSQNYIQNSPSAQQTSSSFNIAGDGMVGGTLSGSVVRAETQFNIGNTRVFFISGNPLETNTIVGALAGLQNPSGGFNSFFGNGSGRSTTLGENNSFFGSGSGNVNQSGNDNSFFGRNAGFGSNASENSFFGSFAGSSPNTGNRNTLIGARANLGSSNLSNATAIGAYAEVTQNNSLILGSINGINGATADTNVGIGTTAPSEKLHVIGNGLFRGNVVLQQSFPVYSGLSLEGGFGWVNFGANSGREGPYNPAAPGFWIRLQYAAPGRGFSFLKKSLDGVERALMILDEFGNLIVDGGTIIIPTLGSAGATMLCRNASNQISNCSSSLRYKTNIAPFSSGLSFINQLRPITFDWKDGGKKDVGFGAEEVAKINPLFVTYNERGEVEGVKYDRLSVAFVNAFREQQSQIEKQQKQIESQQQQIDAMKTLVCELKPEAAICKEEQK